MKGKDLYVLPSSVHEAIVLPVGGRANVRDLREIVSEVNRECVSAEEYLSDSVYLYDWKEDRLTIAGEEPELPAGMDSGE